MVRKALQSFLVIAIAALATQFAPTAAASGNGGHHGDHYDDPEAQMWYEFAEEKAQEINLERLSTRAKVGHKVRRAERRISSLCAFCPVSQPEERRMERRRMSLARRAKGDIGKCTWDAKMEIDACYEDAVAQLEAAGYERFIPKVYKAYNQARQELVRNQRRANHFLMCAANCMLDSQVPI